MELDPLYTDTVIRRWQALTGDAARHVETGETFEAVAAARKGDAVQVGEAVHGAYAAS
ncbi:hypothetical protein [Falsiroseomonas sp.]|uniref:hypothetical protein n=1 Tax=Falsiroseomonas sp. TaxID=2870721 RepID=UPI0035669C15